VIGVSSIFKLIRKDVSLTRVLPTFVFRSEENAVRWKWKIPWIAEAELLKLLKNGQFPDDPVRITV
jgi:hypothetical protein